MADTPAQFLPISGGCGVTWNCYNRVFTGSLGVAQYTANGPATITITQTYIGLGEYDTSGLVITIPFDGFLIDPVPDLVNADGTILQDPESLATLGTTVVGITADGAARLLLRVPATNIGDTIQLTLFNDQDMPSASAVADGTLTSMDGTVVSSQIQVIAVATSKGPMAFVLYFPPTDFVRQNNTNDTTLNQRPVSIQVQDQTSPTTTEVPRRLGLGEHPMADPPPPGQAALPVLIRRRLVYLVHGLWGNKDDFSLIQPILERASTNCVPFSTCVDAAYYSDPTAISSPDPSTVPSDVPGSSLGFDYNAPIVLKLLKTALTNFKSANDLVSAQIDVVAHSMGGDIMVKLLSLQAYKDFRSHGEGSIEKIITVGTPYTGAPLASKLLDPQNACLATKLGQIGKNWSISTAIVGGILVNGAVSDLRPPASGGVTSGMPTAAIKSTVNVSGQQQLNCTFCKPGLIRLSCLSSPLAQDLASDEWEGAVGGAGDAIVPGANQSTP